MSKLGWIASTENFVAEADPAVLSQLERFSEQAGGPFVFDISDDVSTVNGEEDDSPDEVVTTNATGFDRTIFIKVFEGGNKLGEVQIQVEEDELSAGSNDILLQECLDKLGFKAAPVTSRYSCPEIL